MRSLLRMESKQTVSLRACSVSHVPVHDCSFVARSHLSRLRHSCSLLVFTMSLNLSGIELQPTVISLGNALGPPPSVPPSMNNMIGKAPPGSRPPRASPTTLFRARVIWTVVKSIGKLCYGRLLQPRGVPSMDWPDKAWNK